MRIHIRRYFTRDELIDLLNSPEVTAIPRTIMGGDIKWVTEALLLNWKSEKMMKLSFYLYFDNTEDAVLFKLKYC